MNREEKKKIIDSDKNVGVVQGWKIKCVLSMISLCNSKIFVIACRCRNNGDQLKTDEYMKGGRKNRKKKFQGRTIFNLWQDSDYRDG